MSDGVETIIQIRVSEGLKRKIATEAFNREMTLRCYLLSALQAYGLHVPDEELVDRRRVRKGGQS